MKSQTELSFVEQCLIEWAIWSSDGRPVPGEPNHTIEHKLMREGPGAGMTTGFSSLEMSGVVERVEKAVLALPKLQQDVIKMKYLWVNLRDCDRAKKLHMSYSGFRHQLDRARWYIKGQLDGKNFH